MGNTHKNIDKYITYIHNGICVFFGGIIMKKQSAIGLFFSMFLRATVIILGIAIVVFGIVFLMKVMDKDDKGNTPATTANANILTEAEGHDELMYLDPSTRTEAPVEETGEATDTEEFIDTTSYDKSILVLNSTDEIGLAGRWCETLNGYGYTDTNASDYDTTQETTRVISTTPGVGEDLVQYFNGASYEVGTITTGTSEPTDGYDIIIIIGIGDSNH